MLAKLGQAARDIGFFYLTGHGLSERSRRDPGAGGRFFALPEQEKRAVQMVPPPIFAVTTRWAPNSPASGRTGASSSTS